MVIAVLREREVGERRVSLVPESVGRLVKAGHRVLVETGAGAGCDITDQAYQEAGAEVLPDRRAIAAAADIVLTIRHLTDGQDPVWEGIRPGTVLVGMYQPLSHSVQTFENWAHKGLTTFSLDALPRISRAQSMDVLSSMSTIAGYRAVTVAAERLRKFFPMLMTAAGTIPPAKVLVLGAGVAGLQAIATAHRLGAMVQAFDTRAAAREQVESLGATFLSLDVQTAQTQDGYATAIAEDQHQRELALLADPVKNADVVITTAQIPGKPAPILITREMVLSMRPGSVIVDLAGESGGNTEVSRAGEEVDVNGVRVIAPVNIPSDLPLNASQLYSRNVTAFLQHLEREGLAFMETTHACQISSTDEIIQRTLVTHEGTIRSQAVLDRLPSRGAENVATAPVR